ncbi:MAG TPA: response regulator [Bryobacteraceae bacterium]|nr:response regulator [Bryobacteraceae bacterium]
MGSPGKITILLADGDALRRDGLSAVLSGNSSFEVVAAVADGDAALAQIREQQPDVAVIDLNLPKVHGIELIRRIRAEALRTKVVIVASTDDGEIVREVVRAGADGYLLKNGPARHLIDAISYVRDGGQYFSPQLNRDGRNRHLLEEPVRAAQAASSPNRGEDQEAGQDEAAGRRPGKAARRSDPVSLRQRLREEATSSTLDERDYEIMSMMADGIRPIIDRLDEIDTRVSMMETGDADVPSDPRGWLNSQIVTSLGGRSERDAMATNCTGDDLEARLPGLIEDAVTKRFNQMAGRLQREIEETHVRTLEAFVKNIQVKLVQRVSALEQDMSKQAEAMNQLREYSQRTEDNLSRLITGVDKLAQDLPKRLAAAREESGEAEQPVQNGAPRPVKRKSSGDRFPKIVWSVVGGIVFLVLFGWGVVRIAAPGGSSQAGDAASGGAGSSKPVVAAGMVDTKTKLQAAQEAMARKDYAVAEEVYRNVVKAEPTNAEAIKGLASALFREEKTDEAAAVLDKLPKD